MCAIKLTEESLPPSSDLHWPRGPAWNLEIKTLSKDQSGVAFLLRATLGLLAGHKTKLGL